MESHFRKRRTSVPSGVVIATTLILLPVTLLGMLLIDEWVFQDFKLNSLYRRLGIFEPLEGLYFIIARLFDG